MGIRLRTFEAYRTLDPCTQRLTESSISLPSRGTFSSHRESLPSLSCVREGEGVSHRRVAWPGVIRSFSPAGRSIEGHRGGIVPIGQDPGDNAVVGAAH